MYSDALQGSIMFVGMGILLYYIYSKTGGPTEAHKHLSEIAALAPASLKAIGHQGWTAMPLFGFGDKKYDLWWTIISSITLGVGIGVLAQPQLMVRFMTVRSKKELNRAVAVGGVFILAMTGIAFTVGAVSNAYFTQHGAPFTGRVAKVIDAEKNQAVLQLMKQDGDKWVDVMKEDKGAMVPVMVPVVLTGEQVSETVIDDASIPIVQGRSISIVYAKGDLEQIIPIFINFATPKWFGLVFLLVLLSAAMSTLSSQFHAVGTSIGRDVYERITDSKPGIAVTRTGILVGIIIAVIISHYAADKGIIARATGIFFGLCASAFLPALLGALFFRRMTKAGAIASIIAGFLVTAFWLILVKEKEAADIGLVQLLTNGQKSIFYNHPNWPNVDSLLVALPLSLIVAIVVSLVTQPPSKEHLDKCFS
jgi:SSS family solute:Na+ symporter